MIGSIEGKLSWRSENKIIIDTGGVGYLVEVTDFLNIPAVGEKIGLYIYTYVREDTLKLYGFKTMEERELFKVLLSVSRIGPAAASSILSTLSYNEFIKAILEENIQVLKEVSGIGKKTAQRLILELKSKVENLGREIEVTGRKIQDTDELYEALQGLGYSSREISGALDDVKLKEEDRLEDKIKKVLGYLGREKS